MTCKNTISEKISLLTFALLLIAPFSFVSAQTVQIDQNVVVSPIKQQIKIKQKSKRVSGGNDQSAEKSIAVDAKVNISLCVSEGKL